MVDGFSPLACRQPARCIVWVLGVVASGWWAPAAYAEQQSDTLLGLDGKAVVGVVTSIDTSGTITIAGSSKSLKLNSLRRIELAAKKKLVAFETPVCVHLVGRGHVFSDGVTLDGENFALRTIAGQLSVSIDCVRAVRFGAGAAHPVFTQALRNPDDEFDRFLTWNNEEVATLRGFVESIDQNTVKIDLDGEIKTLPQGKLHGIVLAAIEESAVDEAPHDIVLHDGSRLRGSLQRMVADQADQAWLSLEFGEETLRIPCEAVASIVIRSERVQYLSECDPIEVLEQPVVALPRSWKRNKSVGGKPLKIGEKEYASGLGVQARSVLTFATQGRYSRFTAAIGMDASAQGHGDCEFAVRGDGRELFRQRVKATDPAKMVSVSIEGVQRVQLIVEPGVNLDFGDWANWCDACFVR